MTYLLLFYEFFKIGLFAVGGGLATLPFLYNLAQRYPWFEASMLPDMIAVSESTPGPIGVNMATYAGFEAGGVLGSIIATLGLVCPSVIIILIIASFLNRFNDNPYVQSAFFGLRPAVTALIAIAGFEVLKNTLFNFNAYQRTRQFISFFNIKAVILFIIFYYATAKLKLHPIIFIVCGALIGILLEL